MGSEGAVERSGGGYKVVYQHHNRRFEVHSLASAEEAGVVLDALEIMAAVEAERQPGDLLVCMPAGLSVSLSAEAAAELRRGGGFSAAVDQLQAAAAWLRGVACAPGSFCSTPLHGAAALGHNVAAQLLLAVEPALAVVGDEGGRLPLHVAAWHGCVAMCRLLLAAAPQTALAVDDIGRIPLATAVQSGGSLELLQLLLGAVPPAARAARDSRLQAPGLLAAVALRGDEAALQLLLEAFPWAASVRYADGRTLLQTAIAHSCGYGVVARLLAAAPEAARMAGPEGLLPLHAAAEAGCSPATARALLEAAPASALAACGPQQQLPLHMAAQRCAGTHRRVADGQPGAPWEAQRAADVVEQLLRAAPQAALVRNAAGDTALDMAVAEHEPATVRLLLSGTPAVVAAASAQGPGGELPVHRAAASGDVEVLQALLAAAPSTATASDEAWYTPLHSAARGGHAAAVRQLLAAPGAAEACLWSDCGAQLPLYLAIEARSEPTVAALLAACPAAATADALHYKSAIHYAAEAGEPGIVRLLLAEAAGGPGVAMLHDWEGQLPLQLALQADHYEAAAALAGVGPAALALSCLSLDRQLGDDVPSPLYADVLLPRGALSELEWRLVPQPCPGLGRALPAVLAHSDAQARMLVEHLPPADGARLRAFALCLARLQRRLRLSLPLEIV